MKWEEAAPSLLARDVSELVLALDFRLKCINFALDLVIKSRVRQARTQGKRAQLLAPVRPAAVDSSHMAMMKT